MKKEQLDTTLDDMRSKEEAWIFLQGTMCLPPSEALAKALREQYESAIRMFLEGVTIDPWPIPKRDDYMMNIALDTDDLNDLGLHKTQSLREMMLAITREQIATAIDDGENPETRRTQAAETLRSIAAEIETLPLPV